MTAPVADVLRRAVQVLDERGWCQGSYQEAHGRVCGAGAVSVALGGSPSPMSLNLRDWGTFLNILREIDAGLSGTTETWNDEDGRTVDDVKAAFLAAAERAEAAS